MMVDEGVAERRALLLTVWNKVPWVARNHLWINQGSQMMLVLVREFSIKGLCLECMSLMAEVEIVCPYCGCGQVERLSDETVQEV